MPHTTPMSPRGQVTIPKSIRDLLDLQPGDKVEWIVQGDQVQIRRVPRLRELMGSFKLPEGMTLEEAMRIADEERAEHYRKEILEGRM